MALIQEYSVPCPNCGVHTSESIRMCRQCGLTAEPHDRTWLSRSPRHVSQPSKLPTIVPESFTLHGAAHSKHQKQLALYHVLLAFSVFAFFWFGISTVLQTRRIFIFFDVLFTLWHGANIVWGVRMLNRLRRRKDAVRNIETYR